MTRPLHIAIHGAGAVGSALAARLLAAEGTAEAAITLLARGKRLASLRQSGLTLTDLSGRVTLPSVPATERLSRPVDILFLCVKGHDIAEALREDMPWIGPETLVVPLVNGIPWWYFVDQAQPRPVPAVDADGSLLKLLDPAQILGCVVYMTAEMNLQGQVTAHSPHRLILGPATGPVTEAHRRAASLLERAGVATVVTSNIREAIWQKLSLNLATNPLSALSGASVAEIAQTPDLIRIARTIADEVAAIAAAWGSKTLTASEFDEKLRFAGNFPTSMLQDVRAGRSPEFGPICQAPLDLADEAGIAMPTTRDIFNQLQQALTDTPSSLNNRRSS